METFIFKRGDEKKHSVVYTCKMEDGQTFSVYIPKSTGMTNLPAIKMTLMDAAMKEVMS